MSRRTERGAWTGWRVLAGLALTVSPAGGPIMAQGQAPIVSGAVVGASVSADRLVRMGPAELEALYHAAGPGQMPVGRVRGIPIVAPGASIGPAASRAARLVWQGKIFREDGVSAVNRFFGVRAVRGRVYQGTSWLDGRPALVLDYQGTSRIYGRYRDEIREVAPGLYLGLMFARTQPAPTFTRFFAFEDQH